MMKENIRMALSSIRRNKLRSFLTMLGIIVGVTSVVLMVSLGEGFKHQVQGQVDKLGNDLLTVRSGKLVSRDENGAIKDYSLSALSSQLSNLTEKDLALITGDAAFSAVAPLGVVNGSLDANDRTMETARIFGTSAELSNLLNQKVEYGEFFKPSDDAKNIVVIGKTVADELYGEEAPLGKIIHIQGQEFIIRGVFSEFQNPPLNPDADYNRSLFIPFGVAKRLDGGSILIQKIFARVKDQPTIKTTAIKLNAALKSAHGNQEDFTVLLAEENVKVASRVVDLATRLIGGIAAVSLLVGGVGIMNIMLFSVSERTREIGIRKSIGATSRQILSQFLVEALVLCLAGCLTAISLSMLATVLLNLYTKFELVLTAPVVLVACGVSIILGIIFSMGPAIKAARMDPIEALRNE